MEEREIFTEAGCFSINNPFEVHANPLLSSQMEVSFDTLYLSQELVDHCCGKKGVAFAHIQPYNPLLIEVFTSLKTYIRRQQARQIQHTLTRFLQALEQMPSPHGSGSRQETQWEEVHSRMKGYMQEKVSLEELARMMDMDKFSFAKQFRAQIGMSPMHYLMMQRVFAAKQSISSQTHLTELAYEFGFADQAHFSRNFKRFVGISPRAYKKGLPLP